MPYKDSQTDKMKTRTVKGADFIWLLLQHVLPKGFRRVRDYCFLHGNAKYLLKVIQSALGVISIPWKLVTRASFKCPCCSHLGCRNMTIFNQFTVYIFGFFNIVGILIVVTFRS